MKDTLHEDQYTFLIISCSFLHRVKNFTDKTYRGTQNTHFVFNNFFFENCSVHEITWKREVRAGQATDDSMVHAYCMLDPEATNFHARCVILIVFPLQLWLHKCASMLHYIYFTCLVFQFSPCESYHCVAKSIMYPSGNE
jgi:hypothetical protein